MHKVYVETLVRFFEQGGMRPVEILWADGRRFEIAKITEIKRAPTRVSALLPIRYTCMIGGRERFLFYESDLARWFVETK